MYVVKLVARCNLVRDRDGLQDSQKVSTPGSASIAYAWSCQKLVHGLEEGSQKIFNSLQLPLPPFLYSPLNTPASCKQGRNYSESPPNWSGKGDQAFENSFRVHSPPLLPTM